MNELLRQLRKMCCVSYAKKVYKNCKIDKLDYMTVCIIEKAGCVAIMKFQLYFLNNEKFKFLTFRN